MSNMTRMDVLFASQFFHVDLSQHIIDWPLEHETLAPLLLPSFGSVGTGTATARPTSASVVSLVKYMMMISGDQSTRRNEAKDCGQEGRVCSKVGGLV